MEASLTSKSIVDCADELQESAARKRRLVSLEVAIGIATSFTQIIDRSETVSLASSIGRELFRDVQARHDLPPFDQSAMDGYALSGQNSLRTYRVSDLSPISAGETLDTLGAGQAVRIATGGCLPPGADRIALREHALEIDGSVILKGDLVKGANIRLQGEDVRKGERLLSKGVRLDPRKVALLAAQGIDRVEVRARPRVAVVSSGNELRQVGDDLRAGNIFDSNRPMLNALLSRAGAEAVDGGCLSDDLHVLARAISELSECNDLVVLSGGSSQGDADFSLSALRNAGANVEELKIAMKPGKPAIVGRLRRASLLGIPGNPFAAFVSWFTLGQSMLASLCGSRARLRGRMVAAQNELRRKSGRTEFAPAKLVWQADEERLEFLGRGGSARLFPLSYADGLASVEADRASVFAGELVNFIAFQD